MAFGEKLRFELLEDRRVLSTGALITEFMAANDTALPDGDGNFSDWIELHNPTASPVQLDGWHLTDDENVLDQWTFPPKTLDPGQYLVVFASNQAASDYVDAGGYLHTNFALKASGESVLLTDDMQSVVHAFLNYPAQSDDVSYGLLADLITESFFSVPTPGGPVDDPSLMVIISELMYHPSDAGGVENLLHEYIELSNIGSESVDLTGWQFADGVDFVFPSTSIDAGQQLVIAADTAAFITKYPGVTNYVGGWTGRLSNSGERIRLVDASGRLIDELSYADEGDWSVRERGPLDFGFQGWQWSNAHDGGGRSLELIDVGMPNEFGQNWGASMVAEGTPGTTNSIADADGNTAPLILDTTHFPVIPSSTDPVTITARLFDPLESVQTATLYWRIDGSPGFTSVAMLDDGTQGDVLGADGIYSAILPAQPDGTVVEFYIETSDVSGNFRTAPGPSQPSELQETNRLYQVIDSYDPDAQSVPGSQPTYYLIMTELERAELESIGDGVGKKNERKSHAQMNGTFISTDGTGTRLHYNVGLRNRGKGSSDDPPNNYRVNIPHDDPWKGVTALNINSKYTHLQFVASTIFRMGGLPAADGAAVQVRVNGIDLAETGNKMYGSYVGLEVKDGDFASAHFPGNGDGNVYKGASEEKLADLTYLGTDPQAYIDVGYSKFTHSAQKDWSDLIELTDVLTNAPDATYAVDVAQVVDVDQWHRWFALQTLLGNGETNLSNGHGDDYFLYRGDVDPRFVLVPHDLDTVLGFGDGSARTPFESIFEATGTASIARFLEFPEFVGQYYAVLEQLVETTFSPQTIDPILDRALGDYVPISDIDQMKQWVVDRTANVLSQIPRDFAIATNLPMVDGVPTTLTGDVTVSGTAAAAQTHSVTVDGLAADWDPLLGTWTIDQADGLVLNPGINRLVVRTFSGPAGTGELLLQDFVDVRYDDGSQVNISGTISMNTIWDVASGPYSVTDDLTIASGVTLTIEPGTHVTLAAGRRILVDGRLDAQGIADDRIQFTRPSGQSAMWNGFDFSFTMEDNVIAWADMDGMGTAIDVDNARLNIEHVTWSNTGNTIIEVVHPSLRIAHSIFPHVGNNEVIHGHGLAGSEYLLVEGNTFGGSSGSNDVIDFSDAERPGPVFQLLNNVFLGGATTPSTWMGSTRTSKAISFADSNRTLCGRAVPTPSPPESIRVVLRI